MSSIIDDDEAISQSNFDDEEDEIEQDSYEDDVSTEDTSVSQAIKNSLTNKFEIVSCDNTYSNYYSKTKITKPFLTKYEKAKLLGLRAQMISAGSIPMISVPKNIVSTVEIAKLELNEKKIPLIIRRYLPNKEYEDWRLEELVIN